MEIELNRVLNTENIQLEDLVYTYPAYDEENIQTLISGKEEFREVGALVKELPPKRGELFRHQKFFKRFMLQYDSQLVIHQAGVGKSCAALSVTEHYKALAGALEENRNFLPYKRAYILVKGQNLIDEFKYQLLCKCTDGTYITEQILNSKTEAARKSNVSRSVSKYYTITTYGTFAKSLLKMTDAQLRIEFDNSIFIVDEVHNLKDDDEGGSVKRDPSSGVSYYYKMKKNKKTGELEESIVESKLIYDQLWRLFHLVKPRKTMLFSATPMINDASELSSKLNLILPADNQVPKTIDWKTVSIETLEPYFRGLISYVRSLDTGAIPVYQGKVIQSKYTLPDNVVLDDSSNTRKLVSQMVIYATEMAEKQAEVYQLSVDDPAALRPDSLKPEAFDDLKRQAANFIFPDDTTGSVGYRKYVQGEGVDIVATPELYKWISDPQSLRQLSAKYYEIVRLCKEQPGNCWCYNDYIVGSGINVLGLCFEAQGFERFIERESVFSATGTGQLGEVCGGKSLDDADLIRERKIRISKGLRYALLTSDTKGSSAAALLELFNSYENRHGEYIKAVLGSPVTRDGLNLANVLQIHLAGPGWNQASSYQAESRAIRSTSHIDLIEEEKERLRSLGLDDKDAYITIKVYRHAAVNNEGRSVDVEMYEISEKKDREIKRIMRMMKRVAVDCQVNYSRNVRPKDVDGSAICDYDTCAYKCYNSPAQEFAYSSPPEVIDYSSYDVLYSRDIIEAAKYEIIDIFRVVFQLSYEKLYGELEGYRRKFIDLAVAELIENKTVLINRYGYPSYLREDRSTLFLRRDYPLTLLEKPGTVSLSEYSSNLIGIQTMSLIEYNGSMQRESGDILESLSKLTKEKFYEKITSLTLENKILLLEKAVYQYYINKVKNPTVELVIDHFRNFLFIDYEPVAALNIAQKALASRGKGRGRKPKEGSKFKFNEKDKIEIDESLKMRTGEKNVSSKNVIFFHNLSSAVQAQTAYSATAKGRKFEGKIRMLKEVEKIGWRDSNVYEEAVYNEIIKNKSKEDKVQFDIYGTILDDGYFRIIDKTTEDTSLSSKDTRKINRGRICFNGWRKKELIDLLWKIQYNPFKIDIELGEKDLVAFLVSQDIDTEDFTKEKLEFYYTWYTSGSNIDKICELLEKHFHQTGRLVKN